MFTIKKSVILFPLFLTLLCLGCNTTDSIDPSTGSKRGIENSESNIDKNSDTKLSLIFVAGKDLKSRREKFGLLKLSNGTLIVATGHYESANMLRGGEFSKTAEVFNPDLGEWTFTGELNDSRLSPAIFELPDGKVILTGGFHRKNGPLNSTEIWDPITGIWISGPEMIKARHEMSYLKLEDGRFMVIGGGTYDSDGLVVSSSKETEIFDPEIGKWTAAAPMSEKRSNHVAIKLDDGKVFVIGGGKLDGPYSKSSEIYNPDTDSWTIAAPMLKGRVAHTATLLSDGKVLVVGGRGKITKAEIYDPNSDTWSFAGETTKPRAGHVSVRLRNGLVLVTGGLGYLSEVEIYNPQDATWSVAGNLLTGRTNHQVAELPDGRILIIGGIGAEGMLASVEIYEP